VDINENLLGFWPVNKGSGVVAYDKSIHGNDGALEGDNPTWVPGKSGKCINFPGANERINCGNPSPLDTIGNGSFWLSLWMQSPDEVPLNYGALFSKYQSGSDYFLFRSWSTDNRLCLRFMKGGVGMGSIVSFSADTTPFDTEFNHIVLEINRITDKAILYMNKVKDSVEIDISSVPIDASNTGNVSWGAWHDGSNPYEGLQDELRIYSGLPTLEKIEFLHTYPSGIAIPTRIHHLRQQKVA